LVADTTKCYWLFHEHLPARNFSDLLMELLPVRDR